MSAKTALNSGEGLEKILQQRFGWSSFRGEQKQVIADVLSGVSALVLMPTGMGKSLCYQLPCLMLEGLTIVISPLIALMDDQVKKARQLNIRAAAIHSGMAAENRGQSLQKMTEGRLQLLYVTPERFGKKEFMQALSPVKVSLLAVDEAHCISQWGHDFRPDYSRLGEIRAKLGNPTTLALTATATKRVQKDILQQLQLPEAPIFEGGLERPNLAVNVHEVYGIDEKIRSVVGLRAMHPGPTVIYFSLIQTLYKFSQELARLNQRHGTYHGDMSPPDRRRNQNVFQESADGLMLATPAFGLGIDKQDIRMVIHAEMPGSLEAFFQEVGRAGRDGKPAFTHAFYDRDDVSIQMDFIKWAHPDRGFIFQVYDLITDNPLQLEQEGFNFLRDKMNFYNRRDFRVESAVHILERAGCLEKVEPRSGEQASSRFGFTPVRKPFDEEFKQMDIEERLKGANQRLLRMVQFAEMESGCRMKEILNYFDHPFERCGSCDLCLKPVEAT